MYIADKSFREKITFGFPSNAIQMTVDWAVHGANGNAKIDREEQEKLGSNIFSPDYLRAFSQMQRAGNATAAFVFFFLFERSRDASSGRKTRRPGLQALAVIFYSWSTLYTRVPNPNRARAMRELLNKTSIRASPINLYTADRFTSRPCRTDI